MSCPRGQVGNGSFVCPIVWWTEWGEGEGGDERSGGRGVRRGRKGRGGEGYEGGGGGKMSWMAGRPQNAYRWRLLSKHVYFMQVLSIFLSPDGARA